MMKRLACQVMKRLAATRTLRIEQSLPLEGTDPVLDVPYQSRENPIGKCAAATMRKGYSMFAVQDGGWCAASATAPQTFDKYGKSTDCKPDGEGGPWANQVYVIKGNNQYFVRFPCKHNDAFCMNTKQIFSRAKGD